MSAPFSELRPSRRRSPSRWRFAGICFALLIAGTLGGGIFGNKLLALSEDYQQYLKEYSEILSAISTNYSEEIAPEKLVYSSVEGMLRGLDPHTAFLDPSDYSSMQEKQKGSFHGLGIIVSMRNDKVTVISPIQGSPADRLGIRAGDVISEIDGKSTSGQPLDEVVKKLKGPKGTSVRITVLRAGLDEPLELTVVRDEISTTSIRYAFMIGAGTGYIRINDFTHSTSKELGERIEDLSRRGMTRLLLDLRGNPGGLLEQAVAVSDFFLQKGQKVVYTEGRTPSSHQEYFAPGKHTLPDMPLVVLINKGSASASEIVAGAIQDHDRGLVVGTTSWGKGLVQSVYSLSHGAGLALTTSKYFTPTGRCIQRDYGSYYDYVNPGLGEDDDENAETPKEEKEVFFTDTGRKVYGGGGITPDVVVKLPKLSKFTQLLESKGAFFNFSVRYVNRSETPVTEEFQVTPEILADFGEFLTREDIVKPSVTREALKNEADRDYIKQNIREEVLNSKFGLEAGYRVLLEADIQAQSALKLFPEAERLALLAEKSALDPARKKSAKTARPQEARTH